MQKFVIVCAAVLTIGLLVIWLTRRNRFSAVKPYSQIRRQLIDAIGDANAPPPQPPKRPAGLDTRLPVAVLETLRANWPPTDSTWSTYFGEYCKVIGSIREELNAIDPQTDWIELLSEKRRVVLAADEWESEVNNGGFDQFYVNSSGDYANVVPESLRTLGRPDVAELVERANAQFPGGVPPHRAARLAQMDRLPESARKAWHELDTRFFDCHIDFGGIAAYSGGKYIIDHPDEFFLMPR